MKTFHDWKQEQIAEDTFHNGGVQRFRERDWYYSAYGKYVSWYREGKHWKAPPLPLPHQD